jgi:chemotaxis signal transduction protein
LHVERPRREIDWAAVRERLAAAARPRDARRAETVLAERARALATTVAAGAAAEGVAALAFDAGGERYALPLSAVLRVERSGAVARIPGAPLGVAGLVNLHGTPLALLDAPALFGVPGAAPAAGRRWSVVLGRRAPEVAVAADTVEVLSIPRERLGEPVAQRLGVLDDARVVLDPLALLDPAAPGPPRTSP